MCKRATQVWARVPPRWAAYGPSLRAFPARARRMAKTRPRAYLLTALAVRPQPGCIRKLLQRAFRQCEVGRLSPSRSRVIPQKPRFFGPARARYTFGRIAPGPEPVRDRPWDRLGRVVVSNAYRVAVVWLDLDHRSWRYTFSKSKTALKGVFWGCFGLWEGISPPIRIQCAPNHLDVVENLKTSRYMAGARAATQSSAL